MEDTPANGIWDENPFRRGNELEDVANVPEIQTPSTFPKIDYYDAATQTATSVKSTDLFAKTYQSNDLLEELWQDYVNKLVDNPSGNVFPITQGGLTIGNL